MKTELINVSAPVSKLLDLSLSRPRVALPCSGCFNCQNVRTNWRKY